MENIRRASFAVEKRGKFIAESLSSTNVKKVVARAIAHAAEGVIK